MFLEEKLRKLQERTNVCFHDSDSPLRENGRPLGMLQINCLGLRLAYLFIRAAQK